MKLYRNDTLIVFYKNCTNDSGLLNKMTTRAKKENSLNNISLLIGKLN
jgi:hypothetical protein